mmetsp:Transcript_32703/g.79295  ORF Transcript_32703/g.79295 Transcript_32703/m.79295 type:complete len:422 (+) Transcript_32703:81-1346(+)
MMNSAMMMQSPHRDVLEATPDTDDSKARLVEELQSRGRAAVGAKSWMDAKLLYEKALTIAATEKVALLESNLSLVHKNMGSFEDARKAAEKATKADPKYVKGWWRLGQALQSLHRSDESLAALKKAKVLDPTNKALIKECQKVAKKVEEDKKLMEAAPPATSESTTTTTTTTATTKTTTTSPAPAPAAKPKPATEKKPSSTKTNGDDNIFTKSDAVRGYKIVNGKKTSYFHNELSEEAKSLIGDIAPKKIDASAAQAVPAPAPAGASAWNKAGTWEEKDRTKWAQESLKKMVMETTYSFPASSPAPDAKVTVSKVQKLDGHASVARARGKTRYIYEFLLKLEWELKGADGLECSGKLAIPDIDGTIELGEGYEIHEFNIDSVSDNNIRPLIDRFVHRGGFHEALNESIDNWVRLFKKEHEM